MKINGFMIFMGSNIFFRNLYHPVFMCPLICFLVYIIHISQSMIRFNCFYDFHGM